MFYCENKKYQSCEFDTWLFVVSDFVLTINQIFPWSALPGSQTHIFTQNPHVNTRSLFYRVCPEAKKKKNSGIAVRQRLK